MLLPPFVSLEISSARGLLDRLHRLASIKDLCVLDTVSELTARNSQQAGSSKTEPSGAEGKPTPGKWPWGDTASQSLNGNPPGFPRLFITLGRARSQSFQTLSLITQGFCPQGSRSPLCGPQHPTAPGGPGLP